MSGSTEREPVKAGNIVYLKNRSGQYLTLADAGRTKRYYWPRLSANIEKKAATSEHRNPKFGEMMDAIAEFEQAMTEKI